MTWCWRRLIVSTQQDLWIERLQGGGLDRASWVLTERPDRSRAALAVYPKTRSVAVSLAKKYGGQVRLVKLNEWLKPNNAKPIVMGRRLRIVHETAPGKHDPALPQLHIPHGVAFGSGEHATTLMLLRALTRHEAWRETTVLDLGTGSGILALTARLFGARRIVATDIDPEAVRTARQNEALNFPGPLIGWRCSDVKKLRATSRQYDLVVANLFSGILCDAASSIAGCVSRGGQLWLSGVLRSQQAEVVVAYRRQKMKLVRVVSRGKWMMIQLAKK